MWPHSHVTSYMNLGPTQHFPLTPKWWTIDSTKPTWKFRLAEQNPMMVLYRSRFKIKKFCIHFLISEILWCPVCRFKSNCSEQETLLNLSKIYCDCNVNRLSDGTGSRCFTGFGFLFPAPYRLFLVGFTLRKIRSRTHAETAYDLSIEWNVDCGIHIARIKKALMDSDRHSTRSCAAPPF